MSELAPYRTTIEPGWIDYNGHLRDAYYALVASRAVDDVMDQIGLDGAYRERTACTLFTLELHLNYLHEVKRADVLSVFSAVLDVDHKRLHLGCRFESDRSAGPVATAEALLLHVRRGDAPSSAPFPAAVAAHLEALKLCAPARAAWQPGSRRMELRRR